jgi:hypothetical protein
VVRQAARGQREQHRPGAAGLKGSSSRMPSLSHQHTMDSGTVGPPGGVGALRPRAALSGSRSSRAGRRVSRRGFFRFSRFFRTPRSRSRGLGKRRPGADRWTFFVSFVSFVSPGPRRKPREVRPGPWTGVAATGRDWSPEAGAARSRREPLASPVGHRGGGTVRKKREKRKKGAGGAFRCSARSLSRPRRGHDRLAGAAKTLPPRPGYTPVAEAGARRAESRHRSSVVRAYNGNEGDPGCPPEDPRATLGGART